MAKLSPEALKNAQLLLVKGAYSRHLKSSHKVVYPGDYSSLNFDCEACGKFREKLKKFKVSKPDVPSSPDKTSLSALYKEQSFTDFVQKQKSSQTTPKKEYKVLGNDSPCSKLTKLSLKFTSST